MTSESILDVIAKLASVVTAVVAVIAYVLYRWDRWAKRRRLEAFLKADYNPNQIARPYKPYPVIDLMAQLGMTEAEVMDAAFRSSVIRRSTTQDMLGAPSHIQLAYDPKGHRAPVL